MIITYRGGPLNGQTCGFRFPAEAGYQDFILVHLEADVVSLEGGPGIFSMFRVHDSVPEAERAGLRPFDPWA